MTTGQLSKSRGAPAAKKRVFSDEAKARMKEKAKQRGVVRAEAIVMKVREAMIDITKEMTGREDGYLPDGRLVTEALLYERAGVHWTTLSKNPDTYGSLLAEVKVWKSGFTEKKPAREDERRSLTDRLDNAKELYDRLGKNFQVVELELQQAEAERDKALKDLEKAQNDLETVRQENLLLKMRLNDVEASNVLQFPTMREDLPSDRSDAAN